MRSFDGKEIYTRAWDEVEQPKGVIQLCHGMAEHSGRYEAFAQFMNANGYIVFADDHRGHGRTDDGAGHCEGEFVGDTVKDLLYFNVYLKGKYPDLPIIFFGHSYGSCLAQRFIEFDTGIAACVMTGVGCAPHGVCKLAQALLAPVKGMMPRKLVKLGDMGRFEDNDVPHAWLTKDKDIRAQYAADQYSGHACSMTYYYGFVKLMADSSKRANMQNISEQLPVGIFCGKDDPCGNRGKMPAKLAKKYQKLGLDVTLKLYKNDRHEVLNETDREVVYGDILKFIEAHIDKPSK